MGRVNDAFCLSYGSCVSIIQTSINIIISLHFVAITTITSSGLLMLYLSFMRHIKTRESGLLHFNQPRIEFTKTVTTWCRHLIW